MHELRGGRHKIENRRSEEEERAEEGEKERGIKARVRA